MLNSLRCTRGVLLAGTVGLLAPALGLFAAPASASALSPQYRAPFSRSFSDDASPDRAIKFTTLDDRRDLTFNQLLGINNSGVDLRLLRRRRGPAIRIKGIR